MGNLFDYLEWRGDLGFSDVALCEVDSLILSIVSYLDFDGIVPTTEEGGSVTYLEAMRSYLKINKGRPSLGKFFPPETVALAVRAAKTRRFAGIRLSHYACDTVAEEQKQFAALTFRITGDRYFVAFRGTDDTLIGWKENFNMSFMLPVPAQIAAAEYFGRVSEDIEKGEFYLGGHSKGGNLAVYGAVKASDAAKDRILAVFSNDGPGFNRSFIEGEDYRKIKDKLRTIVPQSSVVGMLLEHEEDYEVIKSNATGLMQHHGHTWEVIGGSFLHLDTVTEDSRLIDEKLKAWLDAMTAEERERFVDTVFETLSATNAKTLTELTAEKVKLVKAWNSLEPDTRSVILKCIAILVKHNAITIVIR